MALDRRIHAVRGDVADLALAGTLFAPHYARPMRRMVAPPHVAVHDAPSFEAPVASQLVAGETFDVVDLSGGWAWGFCSHDHHVGYLPEAALTACRPVTHRVVRPTTLIFATADLRGVPVGRLAIGAQMESDVKGDHAAIDGGYLFAGHLAPVQTVEPDPVAVAERLIGTPYLWGGRGGDGVDCSGLVQRAFGLAGHALPRDSDQQQKAAGVPLDDHAPLMRGDLLFFPGHVAIMLDAHTVIHATGWAMAVIVEPLAALVARTAAEHPHPILARRRVI